MSQIAQWSMVHKHPATVRLHLPSFPLARPSPYSALQVTFQVIPLNPDLMEKLLVEFPALPSLPPGHLCPPRWSNHQQRFSGIQLYPRSSCILDWAPLRQSLFPSSPWTQWVHNVSSDSSTMVSVLILATLYHLNHLMHTKIITTFLILQTRKVRCSKLTWLACGHTAACRRWNWNLDIQDFRVCLLTTVLYNLPGGECLV